MKLFAKPFLLLFGTFYLVGCTHVEPLTTFNWQIKQPLKLADLVTSWGQDFHQWDSNLNSNFLVLTFEHVWVQGPDGKTYAIGKGNYPTASNSNAADKTTKFNAQILQCTSHVQLEAKAVAKEILETKLSALQLKKDALPSIAHLSVVAISSVGKGCSFLTLPIGILMPVAAK